MPNVDYSVTLTLIVNPTPMPFENDFVYNEKIDNHATQFTNSWHDTKKGIKCSEFKVQRFRFKRPTPNLYSFIL